MKLAEIFAQLSAGELSQISTGSGENGAILPADYPKLVGHINLGLTALFARFNLKEGRIKLALQPGQTEYPLSSRYAVSNTSALSGVKYLVDSASNRFRDDILKVERVLNPAGDDFALNDEADAFSMRTPSTLLLMVPSMIVEKNPRLPDWMRTDSLTLVYRASHRKLSTEDVEPEELEVDLPQSHLLALLYFVASRVHNPIGLHPEINLGENFAAKYENECLMLEGKNLQIDQGGHNTRFSRGGWI